jgi:hypothetical protein
LRENIEPFTLRLRLEHGVLTSRPENPWVRGRLLAAVLGALAATAVLVPTSLGESITESLFGPGFVRAEVIVKRGGVLQSVRLDRGRVRALDRSALVLREVDGTLVTVPIGPATRFHLGGRRVGYPAIRRGMIATTRRVGDEPAQQVLLVPR